MKNGDTLDSTASNLGNSGQWNPKGEGIGIKVIPFLFLEQCLHSEYFHRLTPHDPWNNFVGLWQAALYTAMY